MTIRWHYDADADAAYLRFSNGVVVESDEISPGVVMDYGADGKIVGMELLGARGKLPSDVLVAAE